MLLGTGMPYKRGYPVDFILAAWKKLRVRQKVEMPVPDSTATAQRGWAKPAATTSALLAGGQVGG